MKAQKLYRIAYWVITVLVLLPTAGSAIPELFLGGGKATTESYVLLGYPLYLMKILGFAKLLGAGAVLVDRSRSITEWAYAGFGILFLGATASHLFAGDPAHAPIPLVFFTLLVGSYIFRSLNKASPFNEAEKQL